MRKSKSKPQGVVDFGTSPHGLSVDLPVPQQETPEALSLSPSAKPVLTFSFNEEQRCSLAFAALCEAERLSKGYEAKEPEVQEAVRCLWEAYFILNGRQS